MIQVVINNVLRFLIFTFLQVGIIQYINFGTYIIPLLYVLPILMLPFETPRIAVLIICFVQGVIIDDFYNQQGLHSAATVFLGFLRPFVLKLLSPREGYDNLVKPTVHYMGPAWFFTYAGFLILCHHLVYFYLEIFRFSEFFPTLLRVILSSIGTLVFVLIFQFLFYRNEKNIA
jgi:hypothetical protein